MKETEHSHTIIQFETYTYSIKLGKWGSWEKRKIGRRISFFVLILCASKYSNRQYIYAIECVFYGGEEGNYNL